MSRSQINMRTSVAIEEAIERIKIYHGFNSTSEAIKALIHAELSRVEREVTRKKKSRGSRQT
jgi:hypothetical protein